MAVARRMAGWIGGALLWLIVAACLAATIVPRFLDRVYYLGPAGAHFDGKRFFNPDGEDTAAPPTGGSRGGFLARRLANADGRAPWPAEVAVMRSKPAARVEGDRMVATWVGHASVLVQTQGLNILTDPIWSDTAGPFGIGPRRTTAPGIAFDDLPKIDLVLVSHNHYDHLDLATLKRLAQRDRPVIVTSLGNDSVIRQAGIWSMALDWGERATLTETGVRRDGWMSPCDPVSACPWDRATVYVVRNHHWSSRWFADRNRALWSSFVVRLPGGNLFFAGDTGFGDGEWPREAAALGPVRLAIVPIGAFRFEPGQMGTGSHVGPPDAVRVFDRLGQPFALPIHWGTFQLSSEARETPPRMLDLLMRCTGLDPARFAVRAVGAAVEVPAVGAGSTPLDEERLAACVRTPEVRALR